MAFESLTDKLQNVFKKLKGKGRLTEADVKVALKEVKMGFWKRMLTLRSLSSLRNPFRKRLSDRML